MAIEFDADKHIYTVDGVVTPSVTQILDILSYEEFGKIDRSTLDYASRRGTAVHECTEAIDLDMPCEVDTEIEPYVRAYLDFLHDYKPKWDRVEEIVSCLDDNYSFCGTIDRTGYFGDRYVIVDIKTSTPSRLTYIKVCLQTYLYNLCIPEHADMWVLFLKKDGTYNLINCEEWWKKNTSKPLYSTVYELLDAYKLIQEIKAKGKKK